MILRGLVQNSRQGIREMFWTVGEKVPSAGFTRTWSPGGKMVIYHVLLLFASPTWCQVLGWPSLPGVPDFVTLKQEVSLGNGWLLPQSPSCQGGTVSSWPSPYHDIEPGSFFVPQNSSYHACHQLILPEGEPGTHCRAGNSRNFTLMGRRKGSGEGREGSPSGRSAPQSGHL